jgi:TetR/AcrR family transcriptional regulator
MTWLERAAERSPAVERTRIRSAKHVGMILGAARKLVAEKGDAFTTQELVKEAGVALQTFYRYFASKDELLLSLFGDLLSEMAANLASTAAEWPDPVARLKFYVTSTLDSLDQGSHGVLAAQFVVSTHWRLHRTFPEELADAQQPYVDLLRTEIVASVNAGQLHPIDTDWAAWLISELVRSVYQRDAYAPARRPETKEQLWAFCLQALGGQP